MPDVREQILDRLHLVVNGVDDLKTIMRNVIAFDDTQLPAAGILEGDEEVQAPPSQQDDGTMRPSIAPRIVTATPQVFIRVKADANVGTDLNTFRARIIKAVLEDAELNALTMRGQGIRYVGQQSTLHAGRSMVGAFALLFQFKYLLVPRELP